MGFLGEKNTSIPQAGHTLGLSMKSSIHRSTKKIESVQLNSSHISACLIRAANSNLLSVRTFSTDGADSFT